MGVSSLSATRALQHLRPRFLREYNLCGQYDTAHRIPPLWAASPYSHPFPSSPFVEPPMKSSSSSKGTSSSGRRDLPKRNSCGGVVASGVGSPAQSLSTPLSNQSGHTLSSKKESKERASRSPQGSRDASPTRGSESSSSASSASAWGSSSNSRRPSLDLQSMKSDYLNMLHITELVNSPMPLDKILQRIVDACGHVVHCERMTLWIVQVDTQSLYCQYSKQQGVPANAANSLVGKTVVLEGIISYVANGSEVLINEDINTDFRYSPEGDNRGNFTINSLLSVPVRSSEGRTVAVLEALNSTRPDGFAINDTMFLKSMAASTSSILKKQEIQQELQQTNKQHAARQHIASLLSASAEMGLSQAVEMIESVAARIVGARAVRLWMLDNDSHTLTCREKVKREQLLQAAISHTHSQSRRSSTVKESTYAGLNAIPPPTLPLRSTSGLQVHSPAGKTSANPGSLPSLSNFSTSKADEAALNSADSDDLPLLSPSHSRAISEYQLVKAEETKIKLGDGIVGMCALRGEMQNIINICEYGAFGSDSSQGGGGCNVKGRSGSATNQQSTPLSTAAAYEQYIPPGANPHLSLLCVPVKDYLGKTLAVLEAVDKTGEPDFLNSSALTAGPNAGGGDPRIISPRKQTGDGAQSPKGSYFGFDQASVVLSNFSGPRSFNKDDQFLLSSLAHTATNVLRNAQLFDEASSRARQTQALLHIIELMSTDIAAHTIIQRIIDAAYKLMNCERITLFMMQEKADGNANMIQALREHEQHRVEDEQKRKMEDEDDVKGDTRNTNTLANLSNLNSLSSPFKAFGSSSLLAPFVRPSRPQMIRAGSHTEVERELICVVSKDESMRGRRLEIGKGIVGTCALTLKSLNIIDAYGDHRFNQENDKKTNFRTKSLLTVPLVDSENNCVAVIQACNRREDGHNRGLEYFSAEDVQILESLANSAGIMFFKSRMNHAALQAEKKSRALLDLLKVVSSDERVPLHEVLEGIVSVTYDVIDCDRVTMYFVEGQELFSIVSRDVTGVRFPIGQGISGYAALHGVGLNIKDAHRDARFDKTFDLKTGYYTQSVLCMPVKDHDGKVLAVIQLLNKKKSVADLKTAGAALVAHLIHQHDLFTQSVVPTGTATHSGGTAAPGAPFTSSQTAAVAPTGGAAAGTQAPAASKYVSFSHDDEEILKSICEQISDCIRKHMSEALQIHYGSNHKIKSLMNLYMSDSVNGSTASSTMSSRQISRRSSRDFGSPMPKGRDPALDNAFANPLSPGQLPPHLRPSPLQGKQLTLLPDETVSIPPLLAIDSVKSETELVELKHGMYHRRDNRIFNFAKDLNSANNANAHNSSPVFSKDTSRMSLLSRSSSVLTSPTGSSFAVVQQEAALPVDPTLFYLYFAWTIPNTSPVQREPNTKIVFDDENKEKRPKVEFPPLPMSLNVFTVPQLSELDDPNFNAFNYSEEELISAISVMFTVTGLSGVFGIQPSMMQNFAVQIRSKYRKNPFHNFYHGFSCLHYTFLLIRSTNMMEYMHAVHVLALFISSLCHDVDHPGRTNTHEINMQTDRALTWNDQSVLENHHSYTTFLVLRMPNCEVLHHLPFADKKAVRSIIIQSILATDMSSHFHHIKRLATIKDQSGINKDDEKDRVFICQVAIHTADLSGQTLPWYIAQQWEDCIVQEFDAQAKDEEMNGIPTEPFMQNLSNLGNRMGLQRDFINFVLCPWYSQVARLFPGVQPFYAQLLANKERYAALAKAEQDAEAHGSTAPL